MWHSYSSYNYIESRIGKEMTRGEIVRSLTLLIDKKIIENRSKGYVVIENYQLL